jgi:hypothetical protein
MFTKKNITLSIIIIIICIIFVVIINLANKNNMNKNNTNKNIRVYSTNNSDENPNTVNCVYINSLSIDSKYLIDYFEHTQDTWYVNNDINSGYLITKNELFSNDENKKNDVNYTKITSDTLKSNQTLNYIDLLLLPFSPAISEPIEIKKNTEPKKTTLKDNIKNNLSASQNSGITYQIYQLIDNIKYHLYNIINVDINKDCYIYKQIFNEYKKNNGAFVIYIDYLHYSDDTKDVYNLCKLIRVIYNIINLDKMIPVDFIIELPRTLSQETMDTKINKIVLSTTTTMVPTTPTPSINSSVKELLNENVNKDNPTSPKIIDLIIGFNIVPGVENNNDISFYNNIWDKYINNSNFKYKFYFDVGNCGKDNIIDNNNIIESIAINPYNITNVQNIISYPYIIDIINGQGKITINDSIVDLSIIDTDDDTNFNISFNNITLNTCEITDELLCYNKNYIDFIITSLDIKYITLISTILPFFNKTMDDEYSKFKYQDKLRSIINNTYNKITGKNLPLKN